jgi:hypothetical protein
MIASRAVPIAPAMRWMALIALVARGARRSLDSTARSP